MRGLLCASACLLAGCHWFEPPAPGQDDCNPSDAAVDEPVTVQMDIESSLLPTEFYGSPYPSVARPLTPPYGCPQSSPLSARLSAPELELHDGYATTAGIFFGLSHPAHPTRVPPSYGANLPVLLLPDGGQETFSLSDGGTTIAGVAGVTKLPSGFIFRIDVPRHVLHPIVAERALVNTDSSCSPGQNLVTLLPVQGRPLDPNALYAAVLLRGIATAPPDGGIIDTICHGEIPRGFDGGTAGEYRAAIDAMTGAEFGLSCNDIGGLTVFKTGDPTKEFRKFVTFARANTPILDGGPISVEKGRCDSARYCTLSGVVRVPDFQHGTQPYAPYIDWDGAWQVDDAGVPMLDGHVPARIVVTLPRQKMPAGGFPAVVLVRAGAGTLTDPLVDRGPTALLPGGSCDSTKCEGPSQIFASAGFAGVTIDGPLVGESRGAPLLGQEDLAIFNFLNPLAMRDNVRQSALELAITPEYLKTLRIPPSEVAKCTGLDTGGGPATIDTSHLAVFAHSMGASIAPLALAVGEPGSTFGAVIFSGSGGSFIENAIYKRQPVPVSAAASVYGYQGACQPHPRDPELSLLQRVLEPADSQVYASQILSNTAGTSRHVLMVQGLVDHYILPPIADTMILGEGLDLGLSANSCGNAMDCDVRPQPTTCDAGIAADDYPSIASLLPLSGRSAISLPVQGNQLGSGGQPLTAVVVQHYAVQPNGCECKDGHEVAYESNLARHQEECFLKSFVADGGARVPASGSPFEDCD